MNPAIIDSIQDSIEKVAAHAQERYGDFRSTHEALGVALEEWLELQEAIRLNSLVRIKHECMDLAAVLLRLAVHCEVQPEEFTKRSMK